MAHKSFDEMAPSVIRMCANSDRDTDIFVRNKGIVGNVRVDLVRLAETYDISRERVRQISTKVLEKVRGPIGRMAFAQFRDVVLKLLHENAGLLDVEDLANGLQQQVSWEEPADVRSLTSFLEVTSFVMVDKENAIIAVRNCPCLAVRT